MGVDIFIGLKFCGDSKFLNIFLWRGGFSKFPKGQQILGLQFFLWFSVVLGGFEVLLWFWFMVVFRSSGWFSVVHGGSW